MRFFSNTAIKFNRVNVFIIAALTFAIVATGGIATVGILGAMALQWGAISTGVAIGGAAGTCIYEARSSR